MWKFYYLSSVSLNRDFLSFSLIFTRVWKFSLIFSSSKQSSSTYNFINFNESFKVFSLSSLLKPLNHLLLIYLIARVPSISSTLKTLEILFPLLINFSHLWFFIDIFKYFLIIFKEILKIWIFFKYNDNIFVYYLGSYCIASC